MRTKRKQQYIARDIYLGHGGLTIDGVHLPWYIAEEVDVDLMAEDFHRVTVTFFANHVSAEPTSPGDRITLSGEYRHDGFDTTLEGARQEAIAIVRAGLADVLEQLDEDCEEWQSGDEWLTDLGKTPHPTPPLARDGGERPKENAS